MSNKNKPKKIVKTKEQLIAEAKQKETATRLRGILKEKIYPELLKVDSVEQTQQLIQGIMDIARKAATDASNNLKVKDLAVNGKPLKDVIDAQHPEFAKIQAILDALAEETLTNASAVLDGFGYAIQGSIRHEMQTRKISDFKNFEQHFNQV